MDGVSLTSAAWEAMLSIAEPERLLFLVGGVLFGLVLGVIPGLSGLIGLSLLLPFTYSMEPLAAIAMLIGLMSVTTTSDTIPAVLFGVPGTVGSAATVLDGHPMAKQGLSRKAFGAAFSASVFGGLFGAFLLGMSIPVLRPLILMVGTPELLACCIFGLSLVAALSGGNAFKGLAAVCLGLLIAMIGEDSQDGELRWTFDTIYLWDGIPVVPIALGLFAIPELADLLIRRSSVVREEFRSVVSSQLDGLKAVLNNKWLVIRCSTIGSLLGAVPGIGAAVIDWIAYGHAAKTEKGASETFGTGDVRGVIASESSNNAKEGGALVPTIAFGVPGSASMALLLGAFTVHGVVPGPDMLTKDLNITYAIVWSVALANIIGAGLCFVGAGWLAKLALVRSTLLVPLVLGIAFIGAFQGQKAWGDLYVMLGAGAFGFLMKRFGWPRPPVILGFVLGALVERYSFISVLRYDFEWLLRPGVMVLLAFSAYVIFADPLKRLYKSLSDSSSQSKESSKKSISIHWNAKQLTFTCVFGCLFVYGGLTASEWTSGAAMFPSFVSWVGLVAVAFVVLSSLCYPEPADTDEALSGLSRQQLASRAFGFFAWAALYLVLSNIVGMLLALPILVFGLMYQQGKESLITSLKGAVLLFIGSFILFHVILRVPWPTAFLGELLPSFREYWITKIF
ncbi:tripartite tricarboxylate transporter permease [Litorivicinus sp.]|nr:tripartite tricarboxylate transporter permease [Litorivicinus sp.]MDC1207976.1 tripartite tricarboxylate transporter permease [Litorivicinus sp.]MDC1240544.1 tripartite tricarboxylate transporter permease [Litorivicinus sp.]